MTSCGAPTGCDGGGAVDAKKNGVPASSCWLLTRQPAKRPSKPRALELSFRACSSCGKSVDDRYNGLDQHSRAR